MSSYIFNFLDHHSLKIKNYLRYRKYNKNKYRFGDLFIILGMFAMPIIPVAIVKNLYMDFWKFTYDLRDFYRTWLLFVIKIFIEIKFKHKYFFIKV